jgi:mannose-6-phosphate isomerase-like protein (cupin superfamily)
MFLTLAPGRGSSLWRAPASGLRVEMLAGNLSSVAGILGGHYYGRWPFRLQKVPASVAVMLLNLGGNPVTFQITPDPAPADVIYDPYLFEQNLPPEVDPAAFRDEQSVVTIPEDFTDTLAKWYSVKYSYPTYNLIFVRPGLGISFQVHARRGEHWEILAGTPIVIAGPQVTYDAALGTEFDLPQGTLHGIINPSADEWAALKETWSGEFDEEDIERVFNPNHYGSS